MTDTEPQDVASDETKDVGEPGAKAKGKAGRAPKKSWKDLSPGERAGSIATGLIQLTLAIIAWTDLAKRPERYVRGPKLVWAVAIAVNFVGPISYFLFGRLPDKAAQRRKRRAKA